MDTDEEMDAILSNPEILRALDNQILHELSVSSIEDLD